MADKEQLLRDALALAARGFPVFPLRPGAKQPALDGWQDKATTDPETIRIWWGHRDYNIGVKTGGGLLVVDIDVKAGKQGAENFTALGLTAEEKNTFRVKTPSGGWHVYYRYDPPLAFGSNAGRLGAGIDVRADGGYVVGPGSVLSNGSGQGSYVVEREGGLSALAEAVRDRLSERRSVSERSTAPVVDLDTSGAVARASDYLLSDAPSAVEGRNGDLATYKVAARLKDFGLSEGVALDLMLDHWNERCSPPWDPEELKEKVEHAYAYGLNPPGADHPAHVFGGVAVEPEERPAARWWRHGDPWNRNVGWLFYQILPAQGVAVVVGAPQSGKTFIVVRLAWCVATGEAFFHVAPDERGGVVYLSAGTEGSSVPMRLAALGEAGALPISHGTVSDLSARGALGRLLEELRAESKRMLEVFGVPLRLVVLETLSASGLLNDENDNSEIARAMANLGTLARELNCLVLTTHHPPKTGSGERGGSAIRGSADYILEIERDGRDNVRRLEVTKARDAEQRQLGTFTLLKMELGEDERGRPITSMNVSMGEPMTKLARRSEHADILIQALDWAILDAGEDIEGHKAVEYDTAAAQFKDLRPRARSSAFKHAVQYGIDIGAVGSGVWAGARYLWIKGTTDDD